MDLLDIIFLGIGVSIDALTIGICNGINSKRTIKMAFVSGLSFAFFQFIMPLLGFLLGGVFQQVILQASTYIVFALLVIFGAKLIREGFQAEDDKKKDGVLPIVLLAFFSSFDSLGVGLASGLMSANLWILVVTITLLTFCFAFTGVIIGKKSGKKHKKLACTIGGIILIALGIKFLFMN